MLSLVVDGTITVIGTCNLDPRSINLNTECITILYSEKRSAAVLEGTNIEFKPENVWHTILDFNPDSKAGIKEINT